MAFAILSLTFRAISVAIVLLSVVDCLAFRQSLDLPTMTGFDVILAGVVIVGGSRTPPH